MRQTGLALVKVSGWTWIAAVCVALVAAFGAVPAAEGQARAIVFDNVASGSATDSLALSVWLNIGAGGDHRGAVLVVGLPHPYSDTVAGSGDGRRLVQPVMRLADSSTCPPTGNLGSDWNWAAPAVDLNRRANYTTDDLQGHTEIYSFEAGIDSGCWRFYMRAYQMVWDDDEGDWVWETSSGTRADMTAAAYSFFGFKQGTAVRSTATHKDTQVVPDAAPTTLSGVGSLPGDLVVDTVWVAGSSSGIPDCSSVASPQEIKANVPISNSSADRYGRLCTSIRNAEGSGTSTNVHWSLSEAALWTIVAASFEQPTPTTAEFFDARAEVVPGGVRVEWQTAHEVDNLGFDVFREDAGGELHRLTGSPVAGSALFVGPGAALGVGKGYGVLDDRGQAGARYWVEAIDLSGQRTRFGPVFVEDSGKAPVGEAVLRPASDPSMTLAALGSRSVATPRTPTLVTRSVVPPAPLPERLATQWWVAGKPAAKLLVNETGWYRVSRAELLAAGFDPGDDPTNLQMVVDGQEVAIRVDRVGDGGYAVEFFGWGLDRLSTDVNVFWLVRGSTPGRRIAMAPFRNGASGPEWFVDLVRRQDRTVYFAAFVREDRDNFFGGPVTGTASSYPLEVEGLAGFAPVAAELEVALQGLSLGAHRAEVSLNGQVLGYLEFEGQRGASMTFPVSLETLVEGENQVTLVADGAENDVTLVDHLTLSYPRRYTAGDGQFLVQAPLGRTVHIGGLAVPRVFVLDVTDPRQVSSLGYALVPEGESYAVAVTPAGASRLSLGLPDTNRELLVVPVSAHKAPVAVVANTPSAWHNDANGADFVILSHPAFAAAVEPLRAHRAGQGLSPVVVDLGDVFDEFSFGVVDPAGIRGFLEHAARNWQVGPESVLLVGDGTLDPRNFIAKGEPDFVPAVLVPTGGLKTPSDDWYVTFEQGGQPELAIGRLPVKTVAEAEAVVAKLMAYDQHLDQPAWAGRAVVVSDLEDPGLNGFLFHDAGEQVSALVSNRFNTNHVSLSTVGRSAGRAALMAELETGTGLVAYAGHSSIGFWSHPTFMSSTMAAALENGAATPVVVDLTCFTGFFANYPGESLGESWLRASAGGAVAVVTPSSATDPAGQMEMAEALFGLIGSTEPVSLGAALMQAKTASGDYGVRRGWLLLGDPTMRVR